MTIQQAIQIFCNNAFFASRAFLPAFITALFARYSPSIPFSNTSLSITPATEWFIGDTCLVSLGILSMLEIIGDKLPSIKQVMVVFDKYLKSGMAIATTFALLGPESVAIINTTHAGISFYQYWGIFCAGMVLLLAKIRAGLFDILFEMDDEDSLGINSIFSFFEDIWVIIGIVLVVLVPIVVFILICIAFGAVYLIEKYNEKKEKKSLITCASCKEKIHPSALSCQYCQAIVENPLQVGILGKIQDKLVSDRKEHVFELVRAKRCSSCATRLTKKKIKQTCSACNKPPFGGMNEVKEYIGYVNSKVPGIVVVSTLLGLIPIIGMVLSVVISRIILIRPYKQYLSARKRVFSKWFLRFLGFIFTVLQVIPLIGAISPPIFIYISYRHWKKTFIKDAETRKLNDGFANTSQITDFHP